MSNQTGRVLELLKRFNDGKKVCINSLRNEYLWEGKSERTIRRDLDLIKEFFPDSFEPIRGQKGCYKAITKSLFENFLNKESLAFLVQAFNIAQRSSFFNSLQIDENDKKIIKAKLEESKKCYEFITKPYESKKGDTKLFRDMERAIHHQLYCKIEYQEASGVKIYEVKPYKIVFMSENFYLACENSDEKYPFTKFRVANIKNIEVSNKSFHKDQEIEDFIKSMQTPFSYFQRGYKQKMVDVLLEVHPNKAKYFEIKKFLPSQEIVEKKRTGALILSYKLTQEMEAEELIKKWIPYIKVIEPLSLKEKIESDLREYLKQ